ncbi:MAG: ABC transporter ATP-binding protein [Clostridia bacterium]|nr:ABC transporter ATP-binding protein [Clostridia bacterium]
MLKKLSRYIGEYKKITIITPILMVLEVAFEVVIPFLMGHIIDDGIQGNNGKGDMTYVIKIGLLMMCMALMSLLFGALGAIFACKASAGFEKNLRRGLMSKVQQFSFANIDRFSTASLVTRMTTDVTNVQMAFQMIIRICFRAPIMLISALVMAMMTNLKLSLVFVCVIVLLGAALAAIVANAFPRFRYVFEKYDGVNAGVQENLTGIRVVKAYVREDHEIKKFHKASEFLYKRFASAEKIVALNGPAMNLAIYACMIGIFWFGASIIVNSGGVDMQVGQLSTFMVYTMNILMNLMMISMIFVMLTMAKTSGERIVEVLDEEIDLTQPEDPVKEMKDGEIVFDHVNFSYSKNPDILNLEDINVTIPSGSVVGVIGGTGAGKSSFVQLIPRLYDVTGGSVRVGGVDVREYDLNTLRDKVSMVLQKNVLFYGTIADNLRWGNENATEEQMKAACESAQIREFVESLPDGYQSHVEQGGTNFSGGQKQRLCIARALLKEPKVLILDDSTSAVDTKTDAAIRRAFREYIPDVTKIIIAQRISSVADADMIIVLDEGKINDVGTHEQLLQRNDIYREVYDSQMRGADFDG